MEKIKELFISKELAILAVKHGFNEPVIGFFDMEIDLLYPSIQEVGTLIHGLNQPKEDFKGYEEDDSVFIDYVGYYYNDLIIKTEYPAITWDQIIKWFREIHNIHLFQKLYFDSMDKARDNLYAHDIIRKSDGRVVKNERLPYYESLNNVIKEMFKLI